jgi:nucleoside-diphosphate kinase
MRERTFTIIKPDSVRKKVAGQILQRFHDEGFEVRGLRLLHLTKAQAEGFYAVHRERPFFPELVEFMTSGPAYVACLERENAVAHLRAVMGPTDSGKAPKETIRGQFGTDIQANAVHGSDSPENARIEISYFFAQADLLGAAQPEAKAGGESQAPDPAWKSNPLQRPPRIR